HSRTTIHDRTSFHDGGTPLSLVEFLVYPVLFNAYFFKILISLECILSLHAALPISTESKRASVCCAASMVASSRWSSRLSAAAQDRKSTRLNSSHVKISYAVFCL